MFVKYLCISVISLSKKLDVSSLLKYIREIELDDELNTARP